MGKLEEKITELEKYNDELLTELSYIDAIMRMVGFSDGLATVKATAREISQRDRRHPD